MGDENGLERLRLRRFRAGNGETARRCPWHTCAWGEPEFALGMLDALRRRDTRCARVAAPEGRGDLAIRARGEVQRMFK